MKKSNGIYSIHLSFEQRKDLIHAFFLCFLLLIPFFMFPTWLISFRVNIFLFTAGSVFITYLLNCLILVPFFLRKKKLATFFLLIITSMGFVFLVRFLLDDWLFDFNPRFLGNPPLSFPLPSPPPKAGHFVMPGILLFQGRESIPIVPTIFPVLFAYTLSTSIEVTAQWLRQANWEKDIENERLNTELLFLKSQINPHFLFNTLNNIYSLAVDKSDDAETAILKLSHMMRYMLYETNAPEVELCREIEYLKNYLSLQKLRLSRQKNININLKIQGNPEKLRIAPLLLIPLVENAFKHGLSYQQASHIDISLDCHDHLIFFSVQNSKPLENMDLILYDHAGIGLKNIRRRLDLLYPQAYQLVIEDDSEQYLVELNLQLL